jgi:hypothetical protein
LLVIVIDVVWVGSELVAANVPLVHGVVGSAPLTVMTPTSAYILVVHETVAVCEPDGGLITWKIKVRIGAVVPESVPGINVPLTPPKLAVMLVALFAFMVTMIIAARLAPLPMMNAGVVAVVTPN